MVVVASTVDMARAVVVVEVDGQDWVVVRARYELRVTAALEKARVGEGPLVATKSVNASVVGDIFIVGGVGVEVDVLFE